jgi:hypothetical protein
MSIALMTLFLFLIILKVPFFDIRAPVLCEGTQILLRQPAMLALFINSLSNYIPARPVARQRPAGRKPGFKRKADLMSLLASLFC